MTKRPRSEECQRLTLATVLPLVQPGAEALTLADGTTLALRWGVVRGCWGDRDGRALLLICPSCGRRARVLHRPLAKGWGCWRCTPVSRLSHRRPGARAGCPKPRNWRLEQIVAEQYRCAALLGLYWPPRAFLWTAVDVLTMPRRPGAPRISRLRAVALALRLDALETLRWALPWPALLTRFAEQQPGYRSSEIDECLALRKNAREMLAGTAWAVRRPARDRRQSRRAQRCGSRP
jgi:hypothetical protein